jgi:hypothetical protein
MAIMRPARIGPTAVVLVATVLCVCGPAQARFEAGTIRFGAGLGLRGTPEGAVFSLGASGGVFLLHGLDLGLSGVLQTGGGEDTLFLLTGDLRFIPLPDLELTPYLEVSGGRLFVEWDDAWVVSAGGGLLYLFGPWYGIDLGVGYRWLIYPDDSVTGDYTVQMGVVMLF